MHIMLKMMCDSRGKSSSAGQRQAGPIKEMIYWRDYSKGSELKLRVRSSSSRCRRVDELVEHIVQFKVGSCL